LRLEVAERPRGPYSFALSARLSGDATRRFRDGVLTAAVEVDGRAELAQARQQPDGLMRLRGTSEEGISRLRAALALDDDHTEFLVRFREDARLRRAVRHLRGLRVVRVQTVAHALLRALCGQLVDWKTSRQLERRIVAAVTPTVAGLHLPPTTRDLARLSPAELRALGLHARRAATLVRICRSLELERLRDVPTRAVAERLGRERGLGPWSVGVVCLQGLGRPEAGLVGDLGLIKLCAALHGREAGPEDTAALLAPYGEWAGLASVYLLAGFGRGLVPLPVSAAA
jgi:AraC family transcriptional regulator of adaptative response / DNA-3-methyladenine glycosylase II